PVAIRHEQRFRDRERGGRERRLADRLRPDDRGWNGVREFRLRHERRPGRKCPAGVRHSLNEEAGTCWKSIHSVRHSRCSGRKPAARAAVILAKKECYFTPCATSASASEGEPSSVFW